MTRAVTVRTFTCAQHLRRVWKRQARAGRVAVPPRRFLVAEIQSAVAAHYRVPLETMTEPGAAHHLARPRQVAMYLARRLTKRSYPDIGRRFGDRHHSTIIHAERAIAQRRLDDIETDEAISAIERGLLG